MLEKLGYGERFIKNPPDSKMILDFAERTDYYRKNISKGAFFGNAGLCAALNAKLDHMGKL
jgi:hypothetical protein